MAENLPVNSKCLPPQGPWCPWEETLTKLQWEAGQDEVVLSWSPEALQGPAMVQWGGGSLVLRGSHLPLSDLPFNMFGKAGYARVSGVPGKEGWWVAQFPSLTWGVGWGTWGEELTCPRIP